MSLDRIACLALLTIFAGLAGCNSLNQTPRSALVRAPGARLYGEPIPVKTEAVKHREFAALSVLAYDAAKQQAAASHQKSVHTETTASASLALGDACESPEQILQDEGWTRWNQAFSQQVEARFDHVHLRVEVWENRQLSIVAVAFGGTSFTDWDDWKANLRWFLPLGTDEYTEIVKDLGPAFRAEFLRRKALPEGKWMSSASLVSTGHSLGGGLAQQFAYALPIDDALPRVGMVYAFDPSPVTGFYSVDENLRNQNKKGLYIDRVFERGEVLAGIRSLTGFIDPPTAKDATIRAVRYQLFFSFNPVRSHSITLLSCHLAISAR